jgi:NDP-sugar pyrophosphorylase family protein
VWQGDEAEVHDSAIVTGPAFIGRRSRISACCRIGAAVAIERDCEVDGGTVVEQSWITQNTYLGVALDFRHSIVNGKELFKLDRNIAMNIDDDHLIAPALKTLPFLASLGDRFRRPESAL